MFRLAGRYYYFNNQTGELKLDSGQTDWNYYTMDVPDMIIYNDDGEIMASANGLNCFYTGEKFTLGKTYKVQFAIDSSRHYNYALKGNDSVESYITTTMASDDMHFDWSIPQLVLLIDNIKVSKYSITETYFDQESYTLSMATGTMQLNMSSVKFGTNGKDVVSIRSSNDAIFTVSETGLVTAVSAGEANVIIEVMIHSKLLTIVSSKITITP